jgi:hypothetical protein
MASLNYNSAVDDLAKGNIDFDTDTFYGLLVTSSYVPNKDTHTKRSDVTNEVANGNGYTTGGKSLAVTVTKDTANDRVDITFADPSWPAATFSAAAMVIYKHRGGASTADELVSYVDFGATVTATNGTFAVTLSSPLRFQN